METLLIVLALLCALIGLAGAIIPVLPGPPLSFLALLLMRWSGTAPEFTNQFLLTWGVIAAVVTVLDYWLPAWFTQKFGGSRSGTVGSVIGMVAGLFLFPPIGIIIGPFIGAFLGELHHDRENTQRALKVAFGSLVAFVVGTGAKLAASGAIIYYIIKNLFA